MKRTLFHGTTFENYELIIKNGFQPEDMVWSCSDDSVMYFYDDTKDADCVMDDEGATIEDLHNRLIQNAFESAQITAGVQGFTGNKLVVFELVIDDEKVEILDDWSCENMSDIASTIDIDYLSLDMIKTIHVSDDAYNPFLRFFYISGLMQNDYANFDNFSDLETKALEAIFDSGVFMDELMEFHWSTVQNKIKAVA